MSDVPSRSGRLLVAHPQLGDPNFRRTVVLVLEHGPSGAVGVVLNRPSVAPVEMVAPGWEGLCAEPPVVFVGGPVQPETAICLGRMPEPQSRPGASHLFGSVASVDLGMDAGEVGGAVSNVRVFAGYSGWGAGQLDEELHQGGWFVLRRDDADVFSAAPEGLWRRVLRRQRRSSLAILANFPEQTELN